MKRLLLSVLWLGILLATAGRAAPVDDARLKGLAWLITHQNGDGGWRGAPGLEMASTASALEALVNAGIAKGETYASAVAWLRNHPASSTDTLARQIMALARAGRDTSALASRLLAWRSDEVAPPSSWGAYDHFGGSFPDTSLALEALKLSGASYAEEGYSVCYIVFQRNGDGGWPHFRPPSGAQPSRILPTAYSLIVLKRYGTSSCGSTAIAGVLSNGVAWLKTQQKTGGGFGEGSTGTVLETALAYRALVTVIGTGDPAAVNAQNYLIAQQRADGGWGGNGALATPLVLAALPAATLADADGDSAETQDFLYVRATENASGKPARSSGLVYPTTENGPELKTGKK
jgi:hypothetical protein